MINLYELYNKPKKLDKHNIYAFSINKLSSMRAHHAEDFESILHIIKRIPKYSYQYAYFIIKGRFLEAEPVIMTSTPFSYYYAGDIIKGRWVEAEPIIMKDPYYAFWYAKTILYSRWTEAEPYIMESESMGLQYCQNFNLI
jgi:hypothetical protein